MPESERTELSLPNDQIKLARDVRDPDAGHWVQRDRPDIVLPAMLRFLDNLQ